MLFGFLHRVTNAIIDLKETYLWCYLHVKFVRSCQITQIFSSSTCALYTSAVSPIFVVLQPNLQDMLTIAQRTCTLHFVFLSASLALLAFYQFGIIEIIYMLINSYFKEFLEEKIGFRKIK